MRRRGGVISTVRLDAAPHRPDDRPLDAIEFVPTRVAVRNRWLGPVVGLAVAIVSFGFGGSLAARAPTDAAAQPATIADGSLVTQSNDRSSPSIVVRGSSREAVIRLHVSIVSQPHAITVDALVVGDVRSVRIRATDQAGDVLATSIAEAHALPSVLVSDPSGNRMSAICVTLPLPIGSVVEEVLVDLIAA